MNRQLSTKRRLHRILYKIIVTMLIGAIGFLLVDARLRPLIKTLAANQAKNISIRIINDAVVDVMKATSFTYDDLVSLDKDASGRITAIKTDSIKMNQLKSDISNAITEGISQVDRRRVSIPAGNLTGLDSLAGRGPRINLYITLSGSTTATIKNIFETAGINQTRHQIVLEITTYIYAIMPGVNTSTETSTNITIAETVIVGLVPEIYAGPNDSLWPDLIN